MSIAGAARRLAGGIGAGVVAGVVGTAAMTASSTLEARLRGRPAGRTPDGLVLDVNGVGYLVAATPSVLRRADGADELTVETYLHVREDALQLYGFGDATERDLKRKPEIRSQQARAGSARNDLDRLGKKSAPLIRRHLGVG